MESPDSNPGTETTNPSSSESEVNDRVIHAVLSELEERGFSREEFPAAIAIGAAAIQTIKESIGPSVSVEKILVWLGTFRDEIPDNAIRSLQDICDKARTIN